MGLFYNVLMELTMCSLAENNINNTKILDLFPIQQNKTVTNKGMPLYLQFEIKRKLPRKLH